MTTTIRKARLDAMRKLLVEHQIDGLVLATGDAYFSEYPPENEKHLEWLTGFSGSAGMICAMLAEAAFFTDGRYTLQAAGELDAEDYEIHNQADCSLADWLRHHGSSGTIGFDPWRVSVAQYRRWKEKMPNILWYTLPADALDNVWEDRPISSAAPAREYPLAYAGKSHPQKLEELGKELVRQGADAALISKPESVNWLLNLRGNDVEYTPLLLSRALVYADGRVQLYVEEGKIPAALTAHLGDNITLHPPHTILQHCADWQSGTLWITPDVLPVALHQALEQAKAKLLEKPDPCALPKALKNPVELENIRQTHRRDGAALTKFLHWLAETGAKTTELEASDKLEAFRREAPEFLEPSFPTIAGFGANGAIVHYRVTPETNQPFAEGNLFLVDSGGQYLGGTTDVTRTIAIGEVNEAMKRAYTSVLKGHIALARAIFPKGTTGAQLDALARQPLWEAGLDYDHGTGHGVGCYLGVHEGPQGISKRVGGAALEAGMILSNEPGYYSTGHFGIRIENLVEVVEAKHEGFLTFQNLTCAPLERNLVMKDMLRADEIDWWNHYHRWVEECLSPTLSEPQARWLNTACVAL